LVQGTSTEKFHTHHIAFEFEIRLHDDDASGGTPVGNGGFRKATDVDLDVSPSKCKSPHMAGKKTCQVTRFHDDQLEEIQSSCNMFAAIRYACLFCILPSFS